MRMPTKNLNIFQPEFFLDGLKSMIVGLILETALHILSFLDSPLSSSKCRVKVESEVLLEEQNTEDDSELWRGCGWGGSLGR